MQATARMRFVRVSPHKARLVVDTIRGKRVGDALSILQMSNKRVAPQVAKVLRSAIANAENTGDVDVDDLVVAEAYVNDGPRMKRIRPAPMGRAYRYHHRLAHIIVVVGDSPAAEVGKQEE